MNTPAHLILGLAAFSRKGAPKVTLGAALGALAPDVSLYVMAGVSLAILQIPPEIVFGQLYFSDGWQTVFAIDNSFLIWGLALAFALWAKAPAWRAFAAAGLLHLALDFPLHHDDGRPHFWPASNWVFESPVSYWDSAHHAAWIAPLEGLMVLICAYILVRRFKGWVVPLICAVLIALEAMVIRSWLLFF